METNESSERAPSFAEAQAEIEGIRWQISQMGANDSEFRDLNQVVTELEAGDITPTEAVARARGIRDSKQAYH